MMWLFSVKNDGTKKARLVGRGGKMIPNVDFDPEAVYCGNIAACSIKLAMVIAATYKLVMRGGDLVGAYLITRANKDFPVFIITPQGYDVPPGFCIQAVGTCMDSLQPDRTSPLSSTNALGSVGTRTHHGTSNCSSSGRTRANQ